MLPSNMQGSIHSTNAMSHGGSGFYTHGRMAGGGLSSGERLPAQPSVGNIRPHPVLNIGTEAEYMPYCDNRAGNLIESAYGRDDHFTDSARRSCKRKFLEGTLGSSSYSGSQHSIGQESSSSSRFTVPAMHIMGGSTGLSYPAVMPASSRQWEEPVIHRPVLMGGSSVALDYRSSALPVTGITEGSQRSVRSRSHSSYHDEKHLSHWRSSGNHIRHVQPRNSQAEQLNMDPTTNHAVGVLCDQSHFPTSSVFQSNFAPIERNENIPTAGSHFSYVGRGRERPPFHSETSSSSMIAGYPNQRRPMPGVENMIADNDLPSRNPLNRNMSGIPHTDPMYAHPILSSTAGPWYPQQNLHMQDCRTNSFLAQGSLSSSRSVQNNHFSWPSGGVPHARAGTMLNTATGLQGPHYLRPSWMDQPGDRNIRNVRSHTRSIVDVSLERLQSVQNEQDRHNGMIPEDVLLFDQSAFFGALDLHDRHRDMRLDVDNMTYEELLALGEQIGNVSTGLTEESISKCLKMRTYFSSPESSAADETTQKCSICQEEFEDKEELGTLPCGHDHHPECIKQWLMQKNECPICKASALKT